MDKAMNSICPDFDQFKCIVSKSIQTILKQYGFSGPTQTIHPPEISLRYELQDIYVTVFYEYAGMPWVVIGTRTPVGKWKIQSLDKIARSKPFNILVAHDKEVTTKSIQCLFRDYSKVLQRYLQASNLQS